MLSVELFSQPFGNSLHGFLAVLMLTEGGETDVAFARWTETDTWSADYAGTIKHLFEDFQLGVLFGVFTQR